MTNKIYPFIIASCLLLGCRSTHHTFKEATINKDYSSKVDSVLKLMTLEEKIGQMNQYTGKWQATGPLIVDTTKVTQIKAGLVGSMLNVIGVKNTREMQEYAMQSRLKIPLLFGLDVIHGYKTIYPIPLAEAASFDLDLMRRTAQGAATETSASGIHWTFAPMMDVSRDARWGRVMEGAGEDTWYGTKVAIERIKGFQGNSLKDINTIMACAKHFAAYGACIAGKDYNSVDMSLLTLHEFYLPPFKAAVEAGVASFMNSFNDINGIPSTGNNYLQRNLLKGRWNFNGMTVSDWGSIDEMVNHGYASDMKDAAYKAITAGCDMDMESRAYVSHLKELVESGEIKESYIDDAVRRILLKKFELGLFDDPFRYCNDERENIVVLSDELRSLSREAGKKSIVLLKNENHVLPLNKSIKTIALIGALADSKTDMFGSWSKQGDKNEVVTVRKGLENKYPNAKIIYAQGYDLKTNELKLDEAKMAASQADITIIAVGERAFYSGEAKSRADIAIPSTHEQLVKELKKSGKKVIVLLMGGRPMIFNETKENADAILLTWWLGTEAGNAIADVISGDYNPSGKLPMTFPLHVGQIPLYYNYKSTGRPENINIGYTCRYQDIDFHPAYPFGYGLSYTKFEIGEPTISKDNFHMNDTIPVMISVKNIGEYEGKETVQLYIRDLVASVTRPVKELRGFQQVTLKPHEEKNIVFKLTKSDLGFYNADLEFVTEPGEFLIMCGSNSLDTKQTKITIGNK